MARITVEDCLKHVDNRFQLVHIASQRARQLDEGHELAIERTDDKNTVLALREIAEGKLDKQSLLKRQTRLFDEPQENVHSMEQGLRDLARKELAERKEPFKHMKPSIVPSVKDKKDEETVEQEGEANQVASESGETKKEEVKRKTTKESSFEKKEIKQVAQEEKPAEEGEANQVASESGETKKEEVKGKTTKESSSEEKEIKQVAQEEKPAEEKEEKTQRVVEEVSSRTESRKTAKGASAEKETVKEKKAAKSTKLGVTDEAAKSTKLGVTDEVAQ